MGNLKRSFVFELCNAYLENLLFILYFSSFLTILVFADELPHVLHDEDYVLKYRIELKDAILRAKAKPGSLLKGYDICIAAHVQPPVKILSAIVRSAGANVSTCQLLLHVHLVF